MVVNGDATVEYRWLTLVSAPSVVQWSLGGRGGGDDGEVGAAAAGDVGADGGGGCEDGVG
jgi:hypothetical protein